MTMRELYIYYRVATGQAAAARLAVETLQARLRSNLPFLVTRLLHRPEALNGLQTWMETYATRPDREPAGISQALQSMIETEALVLAPLIVGPRHTEIFEVFKEPSASNNDG